MKKILRTLASFAGSALAADQVFVEAESFKDHGGWSPDTQFIESMGSPYLLAHGMGEPVKDAAFTPPNSNDTNDPWRRTALGFPENPEGAAPEGCSSRLTSCSSSPWSKKAVMKTSNIQHPTSNIHRRRTASTGAQCLHWMLNVPVRLALLLALSSTVLAEPAIRIINREFPDGSRSSRYIDSSKRESTETFLDSSLRLTHKVVYKLDDRLAPVSAIMYNSKGVIYQKSAYKTDGEDRVIQEVIYGPKDNLLGTKNYIYSQRGGGGIAVSVDTYDANGNLIQTPRLSKSGKRNR